MKSSGMAGNHNLSNSSAKSYGRISHTMREYHKDFQPKLKQRIDLGHRAHTESRSTRKEEAYTEHPSRGFIKIWLPKTHDIGELKQMQYVPPLLRGGVKCDLHPWNMIILPEYGKALDQTLRVLGETCLA